MAQLVIIDGLSGNDSYTKIFLRMEGSNGGTSFTDSNAGGSSHTWTASSATTSTGAAKFGSTSMLCATGGISTPDSADFTLSSNPWTVDFWVNRNGNTGTMGLFGQGDSTLASSSIAGGLTAGNGFALSYNSGSTLLSAGTLTGSAWAHIAYVWDGATITLYVNGVADANTASFAGPFPDLASAWWVGARGDFSGAKFSGYIDEFRLSIGIARWTSNFSLPIEEYGP